MGEWQFFCGEYGWLWGSESLVEVCLVKRETMFWFV